MAALFLYLARHGLGLKPGAIPPPRESPNLGLLHPDHEGFFLSPRDYLAWFHRTRPDSAPGVATGPWWGSCSTASM